MGAVFNQDIFPCLTLTPPAIHQIRPPHMYNFVSKKTIGAGKIMAEKLKYHLKKAELYGLLMKKYKYENQNCMMSFIENIIITQNV
jgi:hypothetical protein